MMEEPRNEEQIPTEPTGSTPLEPAPPSGADSTTDPQSGTDEAHGAGATSSPPEQVAGRDEEAEEKPEEKREEKPEGQPEEQSDKPPVVQDESDGETDDVPPRPAPRSRIRLVNREEPEEVSGDHVREMISMYEDSMKNLEEGEVLQGRVLNLDDKDVLVDIGFKSEGVIPIDEFGDVESIKVGDEIDVFLERLEDDQGLVVLSKQRADFVKVWDRVREAAEKGEVVEGRLVRKIKGGVVVDLFGVEAFLPGSQIALRQPQNIESLMTETLKFKIIKLNKRRRNIVVSRRLVLEEERERAKETILKELEVGQIREGYVKNITDFGAFIDLGGIDGLLHITDMSWGRIRHPSEVISVGDKVQVKLLSFDPVRERISLGLKQLTEYPWERVDEKYPVGSKITGRVVSITDYGAFIELERGVEGLIHISEMSWTKHIRHPSKILHESQEIECMVLKVDKENERISLGLKQVEPDPWLTLDERYPVNSLVTGKVRNLTNFGAFVELEDGIDGLVHISDMSWTRRIGHPSEVLKKGDTVTVRVLSLDKENRRVSLGLKQVDEDPWPKLIEKYPTNTVVQATVAKVIDRGAVVMLEKEVEGFVPAGQLGIEDVRDPREHFREGDVLDLKLTRVDPANRRILLSVKGWLGDQEQAVIDEFLAKHGKRREEEKKEASEEGTEEQLEETVKKQPEETAKEQPEETAKEQPEETAKEQSEETAKEQSEETAKEQSEETVAEKPEEAAELKAEELPDDKAEEPTGEKPDVETDMKAEVKAAVEVDSGAAAVESDAQVEVQSDIEVSPAGGSGSEEAPAETATQEKADSESDAEGELGSEPKDPPAASS
jgi:small subunit ribosomal protein S1